MCSRMSRASVSTQNALQRCLCGPRNDPCIYSGVGTRPREGAACPSNTSCGRSGSESAFRPTVHFTKVQVLFQDKETKKTTRAVDTSRQHDFILGLVFMSGKLNIRKRLFLK